jgi:serine/threonine protein kinase/Cu/Zn superoxide dismutase
MPMEMPASFGPHGAYRVVEEIGKGGFATVYQAYHDALDRYVAIKVLRPEILGDEQGRERFIREARIAARLGGHPNIVAIYDYGEQDGLAYLVLEYIDGTTLQKRLAQPISFAETERIVGGVASALDFAHAHQLVHRDVKESNVLFGNDGRVVLSDFGIAKLLDAMTPVTATMVGTPEYMSPEQILSAQVDGRSDIYALGAMVYRMFSGRPPFAGSPLSVLHQHVHDTPPPLTNPDRPIPPGVEQVVLKALAKNPADRYASAGELAADLSKALSPTILREQVLTTPSPNPADQVQPTRAPPPAVASRPSLPRIPAPITPPPPRDVSPQRSAGARRWIWVPLVALLVLLVGGGVMLRSSLFGADAPATLVPTAVPSTAGPTQADPPPTTISTTAPAAVPPAAPPAAAPTATEHAEHATALAPAPAVAGRAVERAQVPAPEPSPMLAPALATARSLHTSTTLNDGRILVVGGREGTNILATAELYDRSTNAWTSAGSMATPRFRHSATRLPDGKVLIVGGQDTDATFLATSELYDPSTNAFTAAGSLAGARASHTATLLENGKVLVAGGYSASKFFNAAELYDPAEKSWSATAAMADIHSGHTATRLPDGSVLVAGGFGSTTQATAERYDPAANSWSPAGSMAEGRVSHTATRLPNGKVLIAGGVNSTAGGTYLSTAELFDPATNAWSSAAAMATSRAGHVALLLAGDRVLIAGGRDSTVSLTSAELYDPSTNAWSGAGKLAAARWLPAAVPLTGGRILITGGRVGNSSLATTEEYDPATNAWQSQPQTLTMQLATQNNSGMTGTARFTDLGEGKLRVEIHANGSGPGPQPAHIHEGTCSQLNPAPKYPLTPVVNGESVTVVDASIQEVTSAPHAIHMHKSPEELPVYVACADTRVPG